MKNVKECRDVIVKKVLEQGWDTRTTHYTHRRCTAQPNALRPRVEIFAEAVVVFALAWLEKNQNNNNQKEDEHSGVLVVLAVNYFSEAFC